MLSVDSLQAFVDRSYSVQTIVHPNDMLGPFVISVVCRGTLNEVTPFGHCHYQLIRPYILWSDLARSFFFKGAILNRDYKWQT